MKKAVYLSGPITGMDQNNFPEFQAAEERIKALGYNVINPHHICAHLDPASSQHMDYMRVCIASMAYADKVVTLKGWEDSKGANQEVNIARTMGIEVHHIVPFLKSHETLADAPAAG